MTGRDQIGVAFIGAGGICEQRHLPGLAKCPEVELVTVCNRSEDSSRRVAEKWKFGRIAADWRAVLADADVDAVFIGTWPYMHRELAAAALAAGKHVFCQARLCMNWPEANQMVAAAAQHPKLVSMVCPSPHRVRWDRVVKQLLADGKLGELRSLTVTSTSAANCDLNQVSWRERAELSGLNILQVGIFAETLNSWCGDYESLAAATSIPVREKRDAQGQSVTIRVPQIVSIAGTLAGGVQTSEYHSGLAQGYERSQIALFGSKATCTIDLLAQQLRLHNSANTQGELIDDAGDEWRVERQFIDAVLAARRGEAWHISPDFPEAARYMRKMQAIHDSALQARTVRMTDYSAEICELKSLLA